MGVLIHLSRSTLPELRDYSILKQFNPEHTHHLPRQVKLATVGQLEMYHGRHSEIRTRTQRLRPRRLHRAL